MKVLLLSITDTRGESEKMTIALTRHTSCQVRCFLSSSFFDREKKKFAPPFYSIENKQALAESLVWADVIHCFHRLSLRSIGAPEWIGKKPVVYEMLNTVHATDWFDSLWNPEDFAKIKVIVGGGAGWNRFPLKHVGLNYACYLPIFLVEDELMTPLPVESRKRKIVYGVMNKTPGDHPLCKGWDATKKELRGLPQDVFSRLPFNEAMGRKRRAWVAIDEVVTPILHFSVHEYASIGVPCITRYDSDSEATEKQLTGADCVPFFNATMDTLRGVAEELLSCTDQEMRGTSDALRKWALKYLHPAKSIQRFVDLYNSF